ncbi:ANTAR domain-containing protein [Amycolatopsis sp. K13G38]|uniref:ANTAR domain-containing protein n=1 Tax=Amycolatopsis acididurans TaxID=2724524 RepID=A0ABX1J9B0_9PSEU|nr:GAF and ANTAR domain-containing protein [Amycolatopsis acididurans]NKQ56288.1 ANTAR domain-containing protein [Amycolatopsis acididurans]
MNESRAARVWSSIIGLSHRDDTAATLRHVCQACADALPVSGAAILLGGAGNTPELAFATDPLSGELVELQVTYGEGPALDAAVGFEPVLAADLDSPESLTRWPGYTGDAVGTGARAQFAIPLRVGAVRLGALDLHRTRSGELPADALADAVIYADAALAVVLNARAGAEGHWTFAEDEFLDRGAELHQAAGMVSVQLGVPVGEAMVRLRGHAYAAGCRLGDVANAVVHRRLRFSPVGGVHWEEL